jgi:nucleoside-diphosphate-sugar epimerase
MKTVLVTGATGFIGACLVHYLTRRKSEIHVITRETSNKWRIRDLLPNPLVEHVADLRDKNGIARIANETKPDIIYHLATYGAYHFQSNLEDIVSTNISGTANLLNACSKVGFERFIAVGSSSEYGTKDRPMKESDLLEPVDFYGVAKAAASLFCQCFAKLYDMPVSIIRPFSVYGYYEAPTRLVPSVINACIRGKNPRLLSPSSVRDFIFVEDLITAFLMLASNKTERGGETYNVGYGKQYSVSDLVSKVIKITGAPVQPMWGAAPTRARREPKHWVSDTSKIRKSLGWKPKYDLDHGLRKTITWFRKNKELYDQSPNQTAAP